MVEARDAKVRGKGRGALGGGSAREGAVAWTSKKGLCKVAQATRKSRVDFGALVLGKGKGAGEGSGAAFTTAAVATRCWRPRWRGVVKGGDSFSDRSHTYSGGQARGEGEGAASLGLGRGRVTGTIGDAGGGDGSGALFGAASSVGTAWLGVARLGLARLGVARHGLA